MQKPATTYMKNFMDKDFLLKTKTAQHLYHDYAKSLPLIDYHCHISPKEIYENRRFDNLAQVWLGGKNSDGTYFGDHYKWRVMRSHGISEEYVTGDKDGKLRMREFANALEMAIGNPMYHWCNLELRNFFGYEGYLSPETVDEIYDMTEQKLQNDDNLTVRKMIERSNVEMIGTTDDPTDTLEWHEKIAKDESIKFKVLPSFRPDKAINITKTGFVDYIKQLAKSVGKESLNSVQEVCDALKERLVHFKNMGCVASDHGLDYIPYNPCTKEKADTALKKALNGESVTLDEAEGYQTALLVFLAKNYSEMGIVMQLHYSCARNVNRRTFNIMGADTGFDMIAQNNCGESIAAFLSHLDSTNSCPKTIIYSLNPADDAQIGTLLGCFQSSEIPGKIQHGSAWWFNDTKTGMQQQMTSLANLGLLGNFVGMLTDSRSFLSYARHDYFRRILCDLIGDLVENGEYPNDEKALKKIVEGICYKNAQRYFQVK